jgi:hypothetical protein
MTWDGATLTAYIDGEAIGSASAVGTLAASSSPLLIGADGTNGKSAFSGTVDEVRLYNTVLSSPDLSALYHQSPLSVTDVQGGVAVSNLQSGAKLYRDAANTLGSIPSKYLGSTLIRTDSADANSTGDGLLTFTVNQNAIVYVMYDDAIDASHRPAWLADFTDTGDNITDSSGHTFSVYMAKVSAGTICLGGNTSDGVNDTGLMYDVLIQTLL